MNKNILISVTTAKENYENLEKFISKNSDNGIDHFIIFNEGVLDERIKKHEENGLVTFIDSHAINSGEENLNKRQVKNINLAKEVINELHLDCWLINIDSDEFIHFNKNLLNSKNNAVRLDVLEPVIGHTSLYKKKLKPSEIDIVNTLELSKDNIKPDSSNWLHGHSIGKYLAKPIELCDLQWKLHHIEGKKLQNDNFYIIHDESQTIESFKAKFLRHCDNKAGFKDSRKRIVSIFKEYRNSQKFDYICESIYNKIFIEHDEFNLDKKTKLNLYFNIEEHNNTKSITKEQLKEISLKIKEGFSKSFQLKKNTTQKISEKKLTKNDIDYIRDLAIRMENRNLDSSLELMKIAKKLRPNGKYITKKLNTYKETTRKNKSK